MPPISKPDKTDVGDKRRLVMTFLDEDDQPVNPGNCQFKIVEPDGAITIWNFAEHPQPTNPSLGVYRVDWLCAKAGKHRGYFKSTGTVAVVEEFEFIVSKSKVS